MNFIARKKILRITFYAYLFWALIIGASTSALAQGEEPTDDEVNRIAKQLYCPVCESTPLDVCPTEACRQWRDLIRQKLSEGKDEEEIKQYFVAQYGARVLNEPPNRFAAYIVPVTAFLLGALLLFRGFKVWTKPAATESVLGESASGEPSRNKADSFPQDEYIQKFEDELKKRK